MTHQPGQRVTHAEFGSGVILQATSADLLLIFFEGGERQVRRDSVQTALSWNQRLLEGVTSDAQRAQQLRLNLEAHTLPLLESAAALTSARVDLLPHQIVLTHQVAEASPRRFLIADEVGLGKTIETALILRELASRGQLERALMVVPAGLVHNWQRELNEVFQLDFEVFGSEGDVTDRRSNAFVKHHRLIASIDTLKRPARVKRLLEAPTWDMVVFDEAHHLTAQRQGNRVRKTENYKLGEALRGHSRDLLLLSATPHQGDHFTFYMLVQLLKPTLFRDVSDMLENRHRLNEVVIRRTKADACKADGSALFARRWVNTEAFLMAPLEQTFYSHLRQYLEEGFALARRQGGKGLSLGFVMAVFQKIAASSFAAVQRTLRRRLLMLTIHEALQRDEDMDIDARDQLYAEARAMIREEYGLGDDLMARSEADRLLADLKLRLIKRLQKEESETLDGDCESATSEEDAAALVRLALPEERDRIRELLATFPAATETKVQKLLEALGTIWRQNSTEKVVIFATYLGTVDLLGRKIEEAFPGQGVAVLRGGDQGAKVAAEKRFKSPDGPRVLVCTAAGREGINLQFSRILFNFDLPWNPMDMEQRIGRIHRYGQKDTAQVYNLVLSDTIEGRIFILLEDKLKEIARTLGKVDENGNVAEDLRTQILGQLSERLSYDRLYQEALSDPELRRTRQELDSALSNASRAREVVFELFQDLNGFRLEDYQPFADISDSLTRLRDFLQAAYWDQGKTLRAQTDKIYEWVESNGHTTALLTTDRDLARQREDLSLLGLDHPLVEAARQRWTQLPPESLSLAVAGTEKGVLTWWKIDLQGNQNETRSLVLPLACNAQSQRMPAWERQGLTWLDQPPTLHRLTPQERQTALEALEPMLHRELEHKGLLAESKGFSTRLLAWVEVLD